jgi:GntR family histidine utilization transcriptional repressor
MNGKKRLSYRDIGEDILRRIAKRVWEPGALIPGEQALAAEYGCSRATVNRALQDLARAGILERRRKAGTRVSLNPVREARFVIPLVRQEIEAKAAEYRYLLLGSEIEKAGKALGDRLGLDRMSPMLHVRCLHLADGAPYQYEDRWINPDAVPDARDAPFDTVSPNEWLVTNAPFSRAEFIFRAARAGEEEATLLDLPEGEAVFVAERLTWLADKPVTFVRMVHPPNHRIVTEL